MSSGSPEESQRSANQYVRSALTTGFLSIFLLGGIYFLGGKELWESSKYVKVIQQEQASDQEHIRGNADGVKAVRQGLEDVRNADANQRLNDEETRERLLKVEEILASITRRTNETRHEIDAAASRKALQNAETIAVTALADACEQALSKMKKLTVNWESNYATLLTNDRGRQLASNEKSIQAFMVAIAGKFSTVKNSIDWLAEYQEAVHPIREAAANDIDDYSTRPEDRIFFESLLTKTNEANQLLEKRRRAVEVILATTSDSDSGELTLALSIENAEKQNTLLIVQEATRVHQQRIKTIADEHAELLTQKVKERMDAEAALKRQKEDMRTNAANRESESLSKDEALAQEEARKKQLEKEFVIEQSEINRLLGTFLGKGSNQPVPSYSLDLPQWQVVGLSLGPISLGRLASIGALDQTEIGYELLYHIGGDPRNNRSKTGFPQYTNKGAVNPTVMVKVKRASELLNKYGELLVKKRLLAQ